MVLIGPGAVQQLALADHVTRGLGQRNEDIERPAADLDGLTVLQQKAARRHQAVGPERDDALNVADVDRLKRDVGR
jgi:hypothetical protein